MIARFCPEDPAMMSSRSNVTFDTSCSSMMLPAPPEFDSKRRPSSFHCDAPTPVSAGPPLPEAMIGSSGASAGVNRRSGSVADDRIVISAPNGFAGRVNPPTNRVPASSTISSPGCAALSAACRSPPLRTCLISADTGDARRRRTMRTMTGNSIPFGDARYSTDEVGSDGRRTSSSRPTNVEYKSSTSSRCSAGDSAVATPRAPAATTCATASQSACLLDGGMR